MGARLHGGFGSRCNEECLPVSRFISHYAQSQIANSGRGNGNGSGNLRFHVI